MKENNIEEDIKILERVSNEKVIYGSTVGMTLEKYKDLQLSAEHILSDYKRVLKENEELKERESRISREVHDILSFKKFIIRHKNMPDDFNLGRFGVAQTIYKVLKGIESEE